MIETETDIAGPNLNESLVKRLAGGGVDHTNVEKEVDTTLSLTNVVPDELVVDIVRSFSDFRRSHARRLTQTSQRLF